MEHLHVLAQGQTIAAFHVFAGLRALSDVKKKLEESPYANSKSMAEAAWDGMCAALKACGYEEGDFQELCSDVSCLGASNFMARVPVATTPRAAASVQRFIAALPAAGAVSDRASSQKDRPAPAGATTAGMPDAVFLGKVVAAATRQDA